MLSEDERECIRNKPWFSIDVECVAVGDIHCKRDVAKISMVDKEGTLVYESLVKPSLQVSSYLTELTGLRESDLADAPPLAEALVALRAALPRDAVLVGQGIQHDIHWLGLRSEETVRGTKSDAAEGEQADFYGWIDVAALFRQPTAPGTSYAFRHFSLRHEVRAVYGIDIQEGKHDPALDARYSMKLFCDYWEASADDLAAVQAKMAALPGTPSFSKMYPVLDGINMRFDPQCAMCQEKKSRSIDLEKTSGLPRADIDAARARREAEVEKVTESMTKLKFEPGKEFVPGVWGKPV